MVLQLTPAPEVLWFGFRSRGSRSGGRYIRNIVSYLQMTVSSKERPCYMSSSYLPSLRRPLLAHERGGRSGPEIVLVCTIPNPVDGVLVQ